MRLGSTGDDVLRLQRFLNADADTVIAASGAGSPGQETGRFGSLTARAVTKFQEKYASDILSPLGLSRGTGSVGSATRTKLNALCSSLSLTTTMTTSTGTSMTDPSVAPESLIVTTPTQPTGTLAPNGALYVPFTRVTLTAGGADVTVDSMTIRRTGPSQDRAFDSIVLLDEDNMPIDDGRLKYDHSVTIDLGITIPAGESQTITVAANMVEDLADYDGQIGTLEIESIAASVPVTGTFPIKGSALAFNSNLVLGTASASLSSYDPGTSQDRYINDTAIRFSGIRITAGSQEDLKLYSITWDQGGTISDNDISNVVTIVDGVSYPAEADDRSFTSTFPDGILIRKGYSLDAYIQGDLRVSGVNRTVAFDIGSPDNIYLVGQTYGFGLAPSAGGNSGTEGTSVFIVDDEGESADPFFAGSVTTINGATVTSIGRAN